MGRQTSRIYFQGKDHKDCYVTDISTVDSSDKIENAYINGIYVQKEQGEKTQCYWRKSYDYKYICYPHNNSGLYGYRNYAIQYTDLHIKERAFNILFYNGNMITNNKFVLVYATPYMGTKPKSFTISKNGKYHKQYTLENCIRYAALTQDGIICSVYDDAAEEVCELRYIELDEELNILSDEVINGTSGKKWGAVTSLRGADGCFVRDENSDLYFVNKNGVKKIMATDGVSISVMAYGGGKYYVIYYYTASAAGNYNTITFRVAESSNGSSWSHRTIASYTATSFNDYEMYRLLVSFSQGNILYKDGRFLLYKYMSRNSSGTIRWRVYSTTDFRSFTLIKTSPSYMILPIVPSGGQLLLQLGTDAPSVSELGLDDSCATSDLNWFGFSDKAQFENEQIVPFDCLYIGERDHISPWLGTAYYGVYIDNLFFEESENNYAVNPSYGSFGSITDYAHGNGG